jgi:hypothetical protein
MSEISVNLKFYAVRSKDGKWLRAKGYSGYGESWVTDILNAKIYPKIGNARRQITWWSNQYPEYGIPEIVEFSITTGTIIDESDRVKISMEKKKKKEEMAEINLRKWYLKRAEDELKEAQEKYNELKKGK